MNPEQQGSKDTASKVLTVIGFIAIIVFGVWLAVQAVRHIPGAFSSLASLADVVYSNRPTGTLTVTPEKDIVNSGEAFTISWTDLKRQGTYGFSYECADGVSVDVKKTDGSIQPLTCGDMLSFPDGYTAADVIIRSEKARFADVTYTLNFTPTGASEASFTVTSKVTAVNASIPQSAEVAAANGESTTTTTTTTVNTPTTPPKTTTTAGKPVTQHYTYSYIPQSNPNGITDLQVTYLGTGIISGQTFIPQPAIRMNDGNTAVRFMVKNIGTKTSTAWGFGALLPNGASYASPAQAVLRPNESAYITLAFRPNAAGTYQTRMTASGGSDINATNNTAVGNVTVAY